MVRYYSDDGVFDAPVQKVWQLIQAHAEHGTKIHEGLVSAKGTPQPDGSIVADWVLRNPDGKTTSKAKLRMVPRPPYAQTVEFTEGAFKGTWLTTVYIPEGNRTRAVTVAEWKVQGVTDEKTLLKMADDFFNHGFDEDSRYLKTMK